jgi:hypothetical protein
MFGRLWIQTGTKRSQSRLLPSQQMLRWYLKHGHDCSETLQVLRRYLKRGHDCSETLRAYHAAAEDWTSRPLSTVHFQDSVTTHRKTRRHSTEHTNVAAYVPIPQPQKYVCQQLVVMSPIGSQYSMYSPLSSTFTLTPCSRVLLVKLPVPTLANRFPSFYRNRRLITCLQMPVPVLSQINPFHNLTPYFF